MHNKKLILLIIAALSIVGCKSSSTLKDTSPRQAIIGSFKNITSNKNSSIELRLKCFRETKCKLTTISISEKYGKSKHVDILNNVERVKNTKIAQNALRHAIKNQSKSITSQQKIFITQLAPSLKKNTSIEQCWDLNYPTPKYSLACTFTNTAKNASPIFLFFTTMSRCSGAFCRYVIYPMQQN